MEYWQLENNQLKLESKARGLGCVYVGVSFLGLFIVLGASLYTASIWEKSTVTDFFIPGFIFLFGMVFFLTGFSFRSMQFQSTVILDKDMEYVTFYKKPDKQYSFGLGQVGFIRVVLVYETSGSGSSRRSYKTFQVFLVKKDGAHFWLNTLKDQNQAEDFIKTLADYLQIEVKDETELMLSREARRDYTKTKASFPRDYAHPFIKIDDIGTEKKIALKQTSSLFLIFFKFIIFVLFFGAPLIILGGGENAPIFFVIFGVIFGLFWYGAILLIFLLQLKKYELILKPDQLILHMRFSFTPLNAILSQKISIFKHHIKYIRVHRLNQGNYWLSVAVPRSIQIPKPSFIFNMGFINKKSIEELFPDEKVIGLWEIQGYLKPGQGADYSDLLFLEETLERYYRVNEDDLGSSK